MKSIVLGAAACVLALCAYVLWCAVRPPFAVAVGTPIRHDDFLYTVTAVHRKTLSGNLAQYNVDVLVMSQAVRVRYEWRDSIAYLRDASGRTYGPITTGAFTLAPGASSTAHLIFHVPANSSRPMLRFWDGVFMGDALNGVAYAHAAVPLRN